MTTEEIKSALQAKAKELGLKHGKAALHDVNQELLPLAVQLLCSVIPGTIDDNIAAVGTPLLVSALDEAIDGIGA